MCDMTHGHIAVVTVSDLKNEIGHMVLRIDCNIYVDLNEASHWDNEQARRILVRLLPKDTEVTLAVS
jgi:hypothetical protein